MDKAKRSRLDKRLRSLNTVAVCFILWLSACGGGGGDDADNSTTPQATTDWQRDILLTSLSIDLERMQGRADILLAGSTSSSGVSFETGDLIINQVTAYGRPLNYRSENGSLDIGIPPLADEQIVTIDYSFNLQNNFDGLLDGGMSFTWPYHCGNLFPCRSEPSEGSGYELQINGVPSGSDVIYPASIVGDAPAYMLAWTVGDYEFSLLGTTAAGTEVGVYYPPGLQQQALDGSRYLRDAFDWYERTYGAYPFGDAVASVSVDWGPGQFGGMEHHPFWHIASSSLSDPWVHVHEAAHGWFGNGVRIACWEDFVLSEGLVSYLTARAVGAVDSQTSGDQVWASYAARLAQLQQGTGNKITWPSGCQQIDILQDGLFGTAPYMKGAFFFRHLEFSLGVELLDQILSDFFHTHVGSAASMDELLQLIEQTSGYDPEDCAMAWLRSETLPSDDTCAYQ